jgi:phosphoserine phosphatase
MTTLGERPFVILSVLGGSRSSRTIEKLPSPEASLFIFIFIFMTRLTSQQCEFIDSVLRLNPRVATFDCDGTLWSGDAGEGFFSWELDQGLVSPEINLSMRARYTDYKAGKVAEDVMCGEMVTMHRGLREEVVQQACDTYFAQGIAPNIFPEMRELIARLRADGSTTLCEVWAVSSSNQWIIRSGMRYFGIPENRILSAEVAIESTPTGRTITDRLIRVPSGPGKPEAIRATLKSSPENRSDCAFGNAIWDREMLALSKHPYAINPNPDLREIAIANGWTVYQPEIK